MAMSAPAAGSQVHFDIATPRRILAYLNHRIAKIRTALKIVESGMKHAQRLTIQGLKLIAPQSLVKPHCLKQAFGRGIEILAQKRRHATTDAPLGVKAGWEWRHRGSVCAAGSQQSQYENMRRRVRSSEIYTKSSGAVSIGWYETQIRARPWSVHAACCADDCHPFRKKWQEQSDPEDSKRACCHTGWQVDCFVPGRIRKF